MTKNSYNEKQLKANRKAARKTAIILAMVAAGFFGWVVFLVMKNAA